MLQVFQEYEISQIYAYEFLQKMALGLISIFMPIYILQTSLGLSWAFNFLIVEYGAMMLLSFPISYVIAKIGFKHSLVVSYFFYLPAILSLRVFTVTPKVVILSGALMAFGKSFHWLALHAEFAVDSQSKTRGKQTGRMLGLPRIARALAPAIGGALMAYVGFGSLVAVSIFFLGLSAIPLMASRDHRDPMSYSLRGLLERKHAVLGSLFILRGVGSATGKYLFPIYVFFIASGSLDAGIVGSLVNLGSVVFALSIGHMTDRVNEKKLIVAGTVLSAALFSARALVGTALQAYIVSFSAGLIMMIYFIPVFSDLTDLAEKEDVLEFYAFREIFLGIGRVATLIVGLYLINGSQLTALRTTFHIAAAATLLITFYAGWLSRK
ncbi:hypothetical protein GKQ38_05570 [Candidatus Nanohaloarchaea archaeon]|nr:hypothetical protein GKQ38_05570 [Candidatus Nanohaloarchaea archaeon]